MNISDGIIPTNSITNFSLCVCVCVCLFEEIINKYSYNNLMFNK